MSPHITPRQLRDILAGECGTHVMVDLPLALLLPDALAIADDCARADIECNCSWTGAGPEREYDTTPRTDVSPEENESVAQAVRYLHARGLVVVNGRRVRFTEVAG